MKNICKRVVSVVCSVMLLCMVFALSGCDRYRDDMSDGGNSNCDHNYTLVDSVTGDCRTRAKDTYRCSLCGDTDIQYGAYGSHNYVKVRDVDGTCSTKEYEEQQCSYCYGTTKVYGTAYGAHSGVGTCDICYRSIFTEFKNFIIANGTYDSADNEYYYSLEVTDDTTISATYFIDDNSIMLCENFSYSGSIFTFAIFMYGSCSGVYNWGLLQGSYYMDGTLLASTITSAKESLTYSSYDGLASTATSFSKVACSMLKSMVIYTDVCFIYEGSILRTKNFGFTNL
ncbi:MAG: hypothetical protein IJY70_00835 [Clostridia bacterium]|nr:hypothetical protein [Clostridia bacterium]